MKIKLFHNLKDLYEFTNGEHLSYERKVINIFHEKTGMSDVYLLVYE